MPRRDLSESHKGQHSSPATQFKPGAKPANELDLPDDEIIRLYQQGQSSVQIAKKLGVRYYVILRRLRRHNIEVREPRFYLKGRKLSPERRKALSLQQSSMRNWPNTVSRIRTQGGTEAELHVERVLTMERIRGFEREYVFIPGRIVKAHFIRSTLPGQKADLQSKSTATVTSTQK